MDHKDEKLQAEQGSMQQQTQRNDQHNKTEEKHDDEQMSLVPSSDVRGSDADIDREGEPSMEETESQNTAHLDDEIENNRAKRSSWNSITFDVDDFFGGLAPA